jgi:hypothetical protein
LARFGGIAQGLRGIARVLSLAALAVGIAEATPAHALDAKLMAFSKRPDAQGLTRVAVHLSGPVTNDAYEQLFSGEGLVSANSWAPKSIVYLDSLGGNLDEAIRISEEFRRRGVWTAVRPNEACASACVPMLMGGVRRWLEMGAVVIIHTPEVVVPRDAAGKRRVLEALKARLVALSAASQVDPALIDNMFAHAVDDPRLVPEIYAAMWNLASDFGDPFGPFLFTEPVAFPTPVKG